MSDALIDELGALSVSVEDADAGSDAEQALFGEPGMPAPRPGWQRSTLHALFADEAPPRPPPRCCWRRTGPTACSVQSLQPLPDQDWVRLTQSQFEPVAIADGFWVVPSWHEVPAGAQRVIRLDPGLAFGTGTHPTTRMCLRWLAAQAATLAAPGSACSTTAAARASWPSARRCTAPTTIDAVDIDPAAVQATEDNAAANGVTPARRAAGGRRGPLRLVLANILATPLKLLAPLLCDRLQPGGHLVLAGILERQADELKAAYAPWLALQVSDAQDGWILMTGRRIASARRVERMSLATRCPACGTVFRVVSDQLKVSEGWVRCGRCSEVFNAAQRLFELEAEACLRRRRRRPAAAVHRLPVREPANAPAALARVSPRWRRPRHRLRRRGTRDPLARPRPTANRRPRHRPKPPPRRPPSRRHRCRPGTIRPSPAPHRARPPATDRPRLRPKPAGPAPTPEFVRRADRAARWRHPARRGTLAARRLCCWLALLGGQVALHYRDRVAAAWPAAQPGLQAACSLLGCRVEAPRRIDSLNVDSSGLVRMQDSPLYRLSLVVQNKAATAVRMPAIDLALTDSQGQTMAGAC